jgi:hypothetical protein
MPCDGRLPVFAVLLLVNGSQRFDGLDLQNHFVFDDQIGAEPGVDPDVLVGYGDGLLSGNLKSSPGEFIRQDSIADPFQQSRSEGGVDAERASTFMADSIISRQAAKAQRTHPAREA